MLHHLSEGKLLSSLTWKYVAVLHTNVIVLNNVVFLYDIILDDNYHCTSIDNNAVLKILY
jgi:hypothetical protein